VTEVGELVGAVAGLILRLRRAEGALPPEAAGRLAEATRRAVRAVEEWMAELQGHDLVLPLSEEGRRLVALAAMLAASLLHETAGAFKLAGAPEGEAVGRAVADVLTPQAGILVAAALEALAKEAGRLAREVGGAQPSDRQ